MSQPVDEFEVDPTFQPAFVLNQRETLAKYLYETFTDHSWGSLAEMGSLAGIIASKWLRHADLFQPKFDAMKAEGRAEARKVVDANLPRCDVKVAPFSCFHPHHTAHICKPCQIRYDLDLLDGVPAAEVGKW